MTDKIDATPPSTPVQPLATTTPPASATTPPATPPAPSTPAAVKMVPEADLIAAKEGWQGKIDVATQEATTAKEKLNDMQQQFSQASAKLEKLEANQGTSAATAEEVIKAKAETESTKGQLTEANTALLEARRTLIAQQFGVPIDTLKEKNLEQLGHYEEALKAVASTKGIGNYAVGAVGATTAPMTNLDRARKIAENTPVVGVRNAAPNQPPQ